MDPARMLLLACLWASTLPHMPLLPSAGNWAKEKPQSPGLSYLLTNCRGQVWEAEAGSPCTGDWRSSLEACQGAGGSGCKGQTR